MTCLEIEVDDANENTGLRPPTSVASRREAVGNLTRECLRNSELFRRRTKSVP